MAERLGLEPRTRITPSEGLANLSNTIMGSFLSNLDAGDRFARPMHLAYETGVVASLPAITMVEDIRIELITYWLQTSRSPK